MIKIHYFKDTRKKLSSAIDIKENKTFRSCIIIITEKYKFQKTMKISLQHKSFHMITLSAIMLNLKHKSFG